MIPLSDLVFCLKISYRLRGYLPKNVTPMSVWEWLQQFPSEDRHLVKKATAYLKFVKAKEFADDLYDRNLALLQKLRAANIEYKNIIYVSVGEAGSSSHMVLNLLRDRALLENFGCKLIDSADSRALLEQTNRIGNGAIIYVDDFSGTGNQFCEVREFIGEFITGSFSEYFLLHTICEEAIAEIHKYGVSPWAFSIHEKRSRPLHESSTAFLPSERQNLILLSKKFAKKGELGYRGLASMVVFYKNAPNGLPPLFRGDKGQKHGKGLIPRTTDLPRPALP